MEVLQPYQPKNAKIKIEVCETQRSKRTPCFAGILGFSNFSNRNQARAYKLYESALESALGDQKTFYETGWWYEISQCFWV